MFYKLQGKIKVNSKVKPIPFKDRKEPELIIGNTYYVSFGNNNVYPCTLTEIINEYDETEVMIEIPMKRPSKYGAINTSKMKDYTWKSGRILYAIEIGATPEEAVKNTVG